MSVQLVKAKLSGIQQVKAMRLVQVTAAPNRTFPRGVAAVCSLAEKLLKLQMITEIITNNKSRGAFDCLVSPQRSVTILCGLAGVIWMM